CPIVLGGGKCGVEISARHWACRDHWLQTPPAFRCNANRYRRGTPQFEAMIERANKLLAEKLFAKNRRTSPQDGVPAG
ncbi:MAG TPA: hypothetical protein VJR89_31395, partial [Polyangiales bacterium]|nr:hypothetical protein [Polyangiales bacterium]